MHDYSTDADRKGLVIALFTIAGVIAVVTQQLLPKLVAVLPAWAQEVAPYVHAPAPLVVWGVLYWLLDQWLWRLPFVGAKLTKLPDLRGSWQGVLHLPDENRDVTVVVQIRQSWTRMGIRVLAESGDAYSTIAALNTKDHALDGLRYEYWYEPHATADKDKQAHAGTCHLHLSEEGTKLEGNFYTGRGKRNIGRATFVFVGRELHSREVVLTPKPAH